MLGLEGRPELQEELKPSHELFVIATPSIMSSCFDQDKRGNKGSVLTEPFEEETYNNVSLLIVKFEKLFNSNNLVINDEKITYLPANPCAFQVDCQLVNVVLAVAESFVVTVDLPESQDNGGVDFHDAFRGDKHQCPYHLDEVLEDMVRVVQDHKAHLLDSPEDCLLEMEQTSTHLKSKLIMRI
jgi:hypothetical protein